jgi:hypothetical protein
MKRSLTRLAVLTMAVFLFLPPTVAADSYVEVRNLSNWVIIEFYMSPSDDPEWGEDLLGYDVLETGDSLTLSNISCDYWDLMFIDEDEDECVLEEVDLCGDDATWDITDDELLDCTMGE